MATNNAGNFGTGTAGQVLTSNGAGVNPTFQAAAGGGVSGPGSSTDRAIATWNGAGGNALFDNATVKIDSTGRQTNTTQPAFLAFLNVTTGNVTGDNTNATIPYDTIVFDQGGNFNTGTSTFTAPVTGKYQFNFACLCLGGSVAVTFAQIILNTTASSYYFTNQNLSTTFTTQGIAGVQGSQFCDMSSGDTATVSVLCGGAGAKNVSFDGNRVYTFWSGYLVC